MSSSRPAPRLENAASQAYERFRRYFADRDWAAMAELLTADTSVDDHRRVVNAEIRRGRDIVEIANMRAFADIGAKKADRDSHRDSRRTPCPLPDLYLGRRRATWGIQHRDAQYRRDHRREADPGTCLGYHRDAHLRCLCGARGPVPRRRGGRPRADVVGRDRGPIPQSTGTNSLRQRGTG